MARRRMIDPSLWVNEDVTCLSFFERLLLIGLFSNADDEGRGVAKPTIIRSTIFPDDDIQLSDIEEALNHINASIAITFYTVNGKKYYSFENWKKWQRVDKPQPSLIPEIQQENESNNDSENDSENDSRLKERKGREEKVEEVSAREEGDIDDLPAEMRDQELAAINNAMIKATGSCPNGIQQDDIKACIDEAGAELVLHAVKTAADTAKGGFGWKYVKSTLEAWKRGGLTTVEQVSAHEQRRTEKARSGTSREPPQKNALAWGKDWRDYDDESIAAQP